MKKIKFYLIFHCNLAFSSIEEDQIKEVIDKSYFPLLDAIESTNTKTGIEASAYTLEKLDLIAPNFIVQLKKLLSKNLVEIIASGYQQIIGPIVPYSVNLKNQQIGLAVYRKILNIKPKVAFLNEQVYSKSMVDLYNKFYEAICMEWNNPYSINAKHWDESYGFSPIMAKGVKSIMPLIWTNSILFQQFQRTAHAQNSMSDYMTMIDRFIKRGYKLLPIYSSDLEIFNFRPGRFHTENDITTDEWLNIKKIFSNLKQIGDFILPSQTLQYKQNTVIELTNASFPIIVKKQPKYTLSRWSSAGLGGHYINTLCYNCLESFKNKKSVKLWKMLLKYYGSDYRTHTTQKKWDEAITFLKKYNKNEYFSNKCETFFDNSDSNLEIPQNDPNKIKIENETYKITFLPKKGLALENVFKKGKKMLFGSVNHGELDYITHGADYYTGTTTIESSEFGRIANLNQSQNIMVKKINTQKFFIKGEIVLSDFAKEFRCWTIDFYDKKITLLDSVILEKPIKASIRMATFTLLPINKTKIFWYSCKNGGFYKEKFYINENMQISQHLPISVLQSSNGGLGVSDGYLEFGVGNKKIAKIYINKSYGYPLVLLQNSPDHSKNLTRVFFSVQELDDTLKPTTREFQISYTIFL